jgi:hypothetical protein
MKILFFDIENIFRPEHIFHPGKKGRYSSRAAGFCSDLSYVLVFGYAWLGEEPKSIYMTKGQMKKDPLTDDYILDEIKTIMDQADVVVTWYGKGHDYPFLVSRLAARGNYLDPDIKHIDYQTFYNKVNSKKNPNLKFEKEQVCEKLIHYANVMPTYFLVEEEIEAIYYYIQNLK